MWTQSLSIPEATPTAHDYPRGARHQPTWCWRANLQLGPLTGRHLLDQTRPRQCEHTYDSQGAPGPTAQAQSRGCRSKEARTLDGQGGGARSRQRRVATKEPMRSPPVLNKKRLEQERNGPVQPSPRWSDLTGCPWPWCERDTRERTANVREHPPLPTPRGEITRPGKR